jgi:hypothetical protein
MESERNICAKLLELFQIAKNINAADIANLKVHKSQSYALGHIYAFDYNVKHYYVVEDYSLGDNPEYVKNILLDINHLLKGKILKNNTGQVTGNKYAENLENVEYYLWEAPFD